MQSERLLELSKDATTTFFHVIVLTVASVLRISLSRYLPVMARLFIKMRIDMKMSVLKEKWIVLLMVKYKMRVSLEVR